MKKLLKTFLSLLLFLSISQPVIATGTFNLLDSLGGQDEILDPEVAFKISYDSQPGQFTVNWDIAEGHYLYRDKMQITSSEPGITTKPLILPTGKAIEDPVFNETLYVLYNSAKVTLPYHFTNDGDKEVSFKVKYQGCSEIAGICYPPQSKKFTVKLSPISAAQAATQTTEITTNNKTIGAPVSEQDELANTLRTGSTLLTLAIFFGAGLLLAFTPCVFPMIPILSGIIIGHGKDLTTDRKSVV